MANPAVTGFVGFALTLLVFSPAVAQQLAGALDQAGSSATSSGSAEDELPGLKSGSTAFWWSFLGTTVPTVVSSVAIYAHDPNKSGSAAGAEFALLGSLIVGPSLGHFYAARPSRALVGLGIRSLAFVGAVAAAGESFSEGAHNFSANTLVIGGASCAILFVGDVIWDIARAPQSAHDHNDQARREQTSLGIVPYLGSAGAGLCARVAF